MGSITSSFAKEYRLQAWAGLIKECMNRPKGMKVKEWCSERNISKDTYYYWFNKVRKACLDSQGLKESYNTTSIVPVPDELINLQTSYNNTATASLDISIGNCVIHVNESTSAELLAMVMKVSANV